MRTYRHGDVDIKETKKVAGLKKGKDNILAEGEVTGHHHRLLSKEILTYYDSAGQLYLQIERPTSLNRAVFEVISPRGTHSKSISRVGSMHLSESAFSNL